MGRLVQIIQIQTNFFGSFRKLGVPYFGVLIIRILLFRVLYLGSPIFGNSLFGCKYLAVSAFVSNARSLDV